MTCELNPINLRLLQAKLSAQVSPEKSIRSTIAALASSEITQATFYQENTTRFSTLGQCSDTAVNRFSQVQHVLAIRLREMDPEALGATLESMYNRAYDYDRETLSMALGTTPEAQENKRRLDLWIAAIEYVAYEDLDFLEQFWPKSRVREIIALNSPDLTPQHRAYFHRYLHNDANPRAVRTLRIEEAREGFEWLQNYDGTQLFLETPYMVSGWSLYEAFIARFGENELYLRMIAEHPNAEVRQLISEFGHSDRFRELEQLSDQQLMQRYLEISMAQLLRPRPAVLRAMVSDLWLIGSALTMRGVDPRRQVRDFLIAQQEQVFGQSREDTALLLDIGSVRSTHHRLDDYRGRHGLLRQYQQMYRNLLTKAPEIAFSPDNTRRYTNWGRFFLNSNSTGLPIQLRDLDHARAQVLQDMPLTAPALSAETVPTAATFYERNHDDVLWTTPDELGLCDFGSGPIQDINGLQISSDIYVQDLICDNTETLVFLPDHLFPHDHAQGMAFGLFGMALIQDHDGNTHAPLSPSVLLNVISHETAHLEWFRTYFDTQPNMLTQLALNERFAYAVSAGILERRMAEPIHPLDNVEELARHYQFSRDVVSHVNRYAGLEHDDFAPDASNPDWDFAPAAQFMFQPAATMPAEAMNSPILQVRPFPRWRSQSIWDSIWSMALPSDETRQQVESDLTRILATDNDENSARYFLPSDPMGQVLTRINQLAGLAPQPSYAFTAIEFRDYMAMIPERSWLMTQLHMLQETRQE